MCLFSPGLESKEELVGRAEDIEGPEEGRVHTEMLLGAGVLELQGWGHCVAAEQLGPRGPGAHGVQCCLRCTTRCTWRFS